MKNYTSLTKNISTTNYNETIRLQELFGKQYQEVIGRMIRKVETRYIHYSILNISIDEPIYETIKLAESKNPKKKFFFCINESRRTMSTIEINIQTGYIKFVELIENGKIIKNESSKPSNIIFDENQSIVNDIKSLHNIK